MLGFVGPMYILTTYDSIYVNTKYKTFFSYKGVSVKRRDFVSISNIMFAKPGN